MPWKQYSTILLLSIVKCLAAAALFFPRFTHFSHASPLVALLCRHEPAQGQSSKPSSKKHLVDA